MEVIEYLNRWKNLQTDIKDNPNLRKIYKDVKNPRFELERKKSEALAIKQEELDRQKDFETALALFPI